MPRKNSESKIEDVIEGRLKPIEENVKKLESNTKKSLDGIETQFKTLQGMLEQMLTHKFSNNNSESIEYQNKDTALFINDEPDANINLKISNTIPGPEKLTDSVSFCQFKDWQRKFENFITFQGLKGARTKQLSALLISFFNQDILDVVRLVLSINYEEVSYENILKKLEEYFKKRESGRIRRSQFMNRKQEEGESFMSFYREKVKLFQLTDPCIQCYDRCLSDHLVESIHDVEIRKKCRTLPDTCTLEEIIRICESEEVATQEERKSSMKNVAIINKDNEINKICLRCKKNGIVL